MANIAAKVELTDEERKELESLGRNCKMAQAGDDLTGENRVREPPGGQAP